MLERPPRMALLQRWKLTARKIKKEVAILSLAYRDPRVPWYAKLLTLCIVLYALSPIDLIPDFIPVLGYLDDLILLPLGIMLVLRMIPKDVLAEYRKRVEEEGYVLKKSWKGALLIVGIWLLTAFLIIRLLWR